MAIDPVTFKKRIYQTVREHSLGAHKAADTTSASVLSQEIITVLFAARELRKAHKHMRITAMDLVIALFDVNASLQKVLFVHNLDKDDLDALARWYNRAIEEHERRSRFWSRENLLRRPPIGVGWIYGHAMILRRFTLDLTGPFVADLMNLQLVGRGDEIDLIEQTLSRSAETNVLLVGEAGIGKHTIALGLAKNIAEGASLPDLNYKKVFELNVPGITSSSQHTSDIQKILGSVLAETVKVGNVILYIQDFHTVIEHPGIAEVLVPYLESSRIQVLATTDPASFHKRIATRAEILNTFEKIEIKELELPEVLTIVEDAAAVQEVHQKLFFTYGALKAIVEDADRYIQIVPFPEKAIDLLNEVTSWARAEKRSFVQEENVHAVVSRKTTIPVGALGEEEKERLINLASEMHKEIIGQNAAVDAVVRTMQRLRSGLTRRGKPAGVFLFVGPTGVGKTLTAKMLARSYFGSAERMVRFDMSEYQNPESIERLLGSLEQNEPGRLVTAVRDNPFSVLLLDEIEKADKNILNLFLQVFDEARLTDVFGHTVNFENNIIITTSNAASDQIHTMVKQGVDPSVQKEKMVDIFVRGGHFAPEFLNRFDEVVIFHPLTREHIRSIAAIVLKKFIARLRERGYILKPTIELVDYLSDVGFDPQFGARPMNRALQDKIETAVAQKILRGEIQKGTEFILSPEELR